MVNAKYQSAGMPLKRRAAGLLAFPPVSSYLAQQHKSNKEMCVLSVLNLNEAQMRTDHREEGGLGKIDFQLSESRCM